MTATASTAAPGRAASRRSAPMSRLVGAELRWVLRRPRTLVVLGLLALVPVAVAVGVAVAGGPPSGEGPGLVAQVAGNGLVLPVAALSVSLTLLLPLAVASAGADAVAGEAAAGTLRGLVLSPVGRLRLVVMKAAGVTAVASLAVLVIAVTGVLAGLLVVGGDEMITLSGTTLGVGEAMARVGLAAAWTLGQLLAVGAVALAISTSTEHPLVVLACVLGGLIVFGVLGAIPSLGWLEPLLLTSGWAAGADVLRDPMPLDGLASSTLRAAAYLGLGAAVTVWRMSRRDA